MTRSAAAAVASGSSFSFYVTDSVAGLVSFDPWSVSE